MTWNRCVLKSLPSVRQRTIGVAKIVEVGILLHEGVAPDFLERDATFRVGLKHSSDEILSFVADVLGHLVLSFLGLSHHDSQVWIIKRERGREHGIQNDTQAPDVCFIPTVLSVLEKLRGRIVRAATGRGKLVVVGLVESRHTKVGNLDLEIGRDENILRFEVAVADVERVTVGNGTNDLPKEVERDVLGQPSLAIDKCEEVALVDILEDQITISRQSWGGGE